VLAPIAFYSFSIEDADAISLGTSLSQRAVLQGRTLTVSVIMKNTLPLRNSLPPIAAHWALVNMSSDLCGLEYPAGLAVYSGRYTAQNVSSESSVRIFPYFNPNYYSYYCGIIVLYHDSVRFGPLEALTKQFDLNGYWTQNVTARTQLLHPFLPGDYTVFGGDIWGHLAVDYFTVV
jgi:hypothetical protein